MVVTERGCQFNTMSYKDNLRHLKNPNALECIQVYLSIQIPNTFIYLSNGMLFHRILDKRTGLANAILPWKMQFLYSYMLSDLLFAVIDTYNQNYYCFSIQYFKRNVNIDCWHEEMDSGKLYLCKINLICQFTEQKNK